MQNADVLTDAPAPISATSLDPYGQLVKMLMPRAQSIAIYDRMGLHVWLNDGSDAPELHHHVQDALTQELGDAADRSEGFCEPVDRDHCAYVFMLRDAEGAHVNLFTKTDSKRGITSPKSIFEGNGKELIPHQIIPKMTLMGGNDGGLGTTDLIEALDKAVGSVRGDDAVIWLITDNINENSGSGDSSYFNTLEFYKRLRNDDKFKKILLYPIPETVTEAGYVSKRYVVYGIVYSKKETNQKSLEYFDSILRGIGIKQKAITLKPLDIGTSRSAS